MQAPLSLTEIYCALSQIVVTEDNGLLCDALYWELYLDNMTAIENGPILKKAFEKKYWQILGIGPEGLKAIAELTAAA